MVLIQLVWEKVCQFLSSYNHPKPSNPALKCLSEIHENIGFQKNFYKKALVVLVSITGRMAQQWNTTQQ